MKVEPKVVPEENWSFIPIDFLRTMIQRPMSDAEAEKFFQEARERIIENTREVAQVAFNAGRQYQRRNPE